MDAHRKWGMEFVGRRAVRTVVASLNLSTQPLGADRSIAIGMHKKLLTSAAIAVTALLSACAPSSTPMPALQGAHINVAAIPLPSGSNIVLDAATVDEAGAAECAALGSSATSQTFFDDDLGQWSVTQLASVGGDVARQHVLLGSAFVSGYFGGVDLRASHGAAMDIPSNSPFAAVDGLVNAGTTVATLDGLVGHILDVANGNPAEVGTSVGLFTPLLNQIIAVGTQALAQPGLPDDGTALLTALVNAATAALTAATAGSAGDIGAARRAEEAATGILTWAAGYYLGLTAPAPIAAPTLTC
jgi:hypothetical protein